jgi:hypothetical protein
MCFGKERRRSPAHVETQFRRRSELDRKYCATTTMRVLGGRVLEELLRPNGEFSRRKVFARRI